MQFTECFRRTAHWIDSLFTGVTLEQLDDPTPCGDWTVRDLMNHLVASNHLFARVGMGASPPPIDVDTVNYLGNDPSSAYAVSAEAVEVVFAEPGILDRMMQMPGSPPMPGRVALGLAFADALVHGIDLAKATGQDATADPELVAVADALWRQAPTDMLRDSGLLGPEVPCRDEAPLQDRLLALLGRQP